MVVTDARLSLAKKILAAGAFVGIIFGCGVTPQNSTPNSFVCNPTPSDISAFYTGGSSPWVTIQNNCLTCHGISSPTTNLRSRMRFNDNPAQQSSTTQQENLCVAYQFGQNSPSQALITHPQQPDHDGGAQVFSAVGIAALINWVNTYSLPSH